MSVKGVSLKAAKILGFFILGIVVLLVAAVLLVRLPGVQNRIVGELEKYLQDKLQTRVEIGRAFVGFPTSVEIEDVYLQDQQGDTLLYLTEASISTNLWGLLENKVSLNAIGVDGLVARVVKLPDDSTFNYSFVIEAFASDTTPADTTASPWEITIGDISLTNFDISYNEKQSELAAALSWSELVVALDDLNPSETEFKTGKIALTGARIRYTEGTGAPANNTAAPPAPGEQPPPDYLFVVDELLISNSSAVFNSEAVDADVFIDEFGVDAATVNMKEMMADIAGLRLQNSRVAIGMPATADEDTTTAAQPATVATTTTPANGWSVKLGELALEKNNIAYDVGEAVRADGFDPNHIKLEGLSGLVSDVAYDGSLIQAGISSLTFREGDNFTLFDTGADFYMNDTTLNVKNIDIHTRESHLRGSVSLAFSAPDQIGSGSTRVALQMTNSFIHPADLLYFDPHALDSVPVRKPFNFPLSFEVKADGRIDDLNLTRLEMKLLSDTHLLLAGNVKGLPDAENITFGFSNIHLSSSGRNVTRLLADSLLPAGIQLPASFGLQATASGAPDNLQANGTLTSSFGDFVLDATYDATRVPNPVYDLSVRTDGFNLGSLIKDTVNFQQLALDFSVAGSGTEPDSIRAEIEGRIAAIDYQKYVYNDINISGQLTNVLFNGNISIDDENLKFTFDGDIDYGSDEMSYKVDLDLDYADLEALNLRKTPLVLTAQIDSDLQTADFRKFKGDFAIRQFSANNGIGTYRVDSLLFASVEQEGRTDITIDSDMMEGYFRGDIDIPSLPAVLSEHIDRYYDLDDYDAAKADSVQQFEFFLDLKKTDLLTEILVPGLESIDPGIFEGSFDSEKHQLAMTLSINEMVYSGISIDSLVILVRSDADELTTRVNLNELSTANSVMRGFDFDGVLADNIYHIRLEVPDTTGMPAYLLRGNFESLEQSAFRFEIEPDSLILAYTPWVARESNYLLFKEPGFSAHNFELTNGEQRVKIEGTVAQDSLASIAFENFNLGGLAEGMKKEDDVLAGTLEGSVDITLLEDAYAIDAGLQIAGLGYLGQTWGDLQIDIKNGGSKLYNVDVALAGPNVATIRGTYDTDSAAANQLDFKIRLEQLNLSLLEPVTGETVRDIAGTMKANIDITGAPADPGINGDIRFINTTFTPAMLNSALTVSNETLRFRNSTLSFDNFELADANKNTASLDGSVAIENASFYTFDLSLEAQNFQVLNTTADDNEMYFGNLNINMNASVTGSSARPNVNFDMEVNRGSKLTYVLIETQEQALNQPNVVKFIDPADTLRASPNPDVIDSVSYAFQGMELTANIELHDNSTLQIVIDPITQDQLTVQGDANLSLAMNRAGDLQLSGRYTLSEGAYQLSFYQVLKRNFTIAPGSTITWTGDPLGAQLDITALTTVEAQPIDLVINQISNANTSQLNRYRQRLPFEVALNIEGNLSGPEISFGLDMPEANRNALEGSIYARIQEINSRESDLNKQVFALLVLKRFISDNPLASEGGTSFEDNARRSVSRLLSEQLNKLTDNVGGVQLDVNVESYEDYSSGDVENRTDLELGVSKSLFDERLTVKVAGNVALEGNRQQQQNLSDYIGDLLLEYKLTEDGRLRLLGFRRNEFDIVNGEIIETGTGVIYVRDYNKFKELFNLNDKEYQFK